MRIRSAIFHLLSPKQPMISSLIKRHLIQHGWVTREAHDQLQRRIESLESMVEKTQSNPIPPSKSTELPCAEKTES